MTTWTEIPVILLFFVLRLGLPLALILLLGWFLRRLDARWTREAQRQRQGIEDPAPQLTATDRRSTPCWVLKGCPESTHRSCPAYLMRSLPCWLARLRNEGCVPVHCANCALFHAQF
jgi:hypothetical protein